MDAVPPPSLPPLRHHPRHLVAYRPSRLLLLAILRRRRFLSLTPAPYAQMSRLDPTNLREL